jgi:hypothetical protein
MLVLAKTYPTISKKYEHLVCIAGLTEDNEWRRVYPVPWQLFWRGSEKKFKKKSWIRYRLEDTKPSDRRPESRKIDFSSIEVLGEASYREIKKRLDEKLTILDELQSKDDSTASLGVIKPRIKDLIWSDSEYHEKIQDMCCQLTLFDGKSAVKIDVPDKKFQYIFRCSDACTKQHTIMCEDWEMGMLYLNSVRRHKDREKAAHIVRGKFLNEIPSLKYIYFMVGTHNRYPNTWLIISVLYPRKAEIQEIETADILEFV